MAKEDFKKFQELLRALFLDGSAYDRQKLAVLLGISPHTLDKAIRELRDMSEQTAPGTFVANRGRRLSFSLKHRHYESTGNFLLFLYRLKMLRTKEKSRLLQVISNLFEEPGSTIEDFMAAIDQKTDEENWKRRKQDRVEHIEPVERTAVLSYLRYLEDIGVLEKKEDDTYYPVCDVYDALTAEELLELYHYVDYQANTGLLSVLGYLLAANYPSGHLHRMLVENIMDITPGDPVPEDWFLSCLARAEQELAIGWGVSGGRPTKVRIKFYFDAVSGSFNFIRERVRREGQHGTIVEEGDDFFI